MPMLDAYIPEGALPADVEKKLLSTLTDVLLEHEGADPTNPAARVDPQAAAKPVADPIPLELG